MLGVLFTLLKGVRTDPWGVGVFDLDLLTILTAYLFLSFGRIQAGVFALGQGFLIDIFSSAFDGLFIFLYLIVFWGIYLGSLFFNFQTPKGQILIVSLAVLFKHVMLLAVLALFSTRVVFSTSFLCASTVSVIGTGLITPILFGLFNRFKGISGREDDAPSLEELET